MFIPEGHRQAVGSDGQLLRVVESVISKKSRARSELSCTEKSLLREMLGRTRVLTGSLRGRPR